LKSADISACADKSAGFPSPPSSSIESGSTVTLLIPAAYASFRRKLFVGTALAETVSTETKKGGEPNENCKIISRSRAFSR
jgi:hypothetical protein